MNKRKRIETTDKYMELSKSIGVPPDALLDLLVDFYRGDRLDLLLDLIKNKYNRGLNAIDIVYLSLLYTLLQRIDYKIDLS